MSCPMQFVFYAAELKPALFADKKYLHIDMSAGGVQFQNKTQNDNLRTVLLDPPMPYAFLFHELFCV